MGCECRGQRLCYRFLDTLILIIASQITGIDSVTNTPVNKQYEVIVAHINAVRALPGLLNSRVIFAPESNLGAEGVRLTDDLRRARLHNTYVLREHGGQEGFITNEKNKKQMWISMSSALNEHRVRFHPNMVCANLRQGHTPGSMREMFVKELLNYKRRLVYSQSDPYKLPKELFTGKIGGACDDHAIVGQLLYISREIYRQKLSFYRGQQPIYSQGDEQAQLHLRRTETFLSGSSKF